MSVTKHKEKANHFKMNPRLPRFSNDFILLISFGE